MQGNKTQMTFVVHEYGLVTSLVTIEDMPEELVSEIQDEFDHESSFVIKQSKSSYLVNVQKSISDLNKYLKEQRLQEKKIHINPRNLYLRCLISYLFSRTAFYSYWQIFSQNLKKQRP